MKKNLVLSGILLYVIFQKSFFMLSSIAGIILIKYDINQYMYISFLILAGILSLVLTILLLKNVIKKADNLKIDRKIILIFVVVLILFLLSNKFGSYLAENNQMIDLKKLKYFIYPDIVFTVTILFGILYLILKNKDKIASS